jgi:hypothetical protein
MPATAERRNDDQFKGEVLSSLKSIHEKMADLKVDMTERMDDLKEDMTARTDAISLLLAEQERECKRTHLQLNNEMGCLRERSENNKHCSSQSWDMWNKVFVAMITGVVAFSLWFVQNHIAASSILKK